VRQLIVNAKVFNQRERMEWRLADALEFLARGLRKHYAPLAAAAAEDVPVQHAEEEEPSAAEEAAADAEEKDEAEAEDGFFAVPEPDNDSEAMDEETESGGHVEV
jgi:hypothetical protein